MKDASCWDRFLRCCLAFSLCLLWFVVASNKRQSDEQLKQLRERVEALSPTKEPQP